MFYTLILKPLLFRYDPESVHDFFTKLGQFSGRHMITRKIVDIIYGYHGPDISKKVDGITYRTPFLLSAGFDYNAQLTNILGSIGLGGEEAGSVTARPCAGNPKPRLTRLPLSQSILVNKGLKNEGVNQVIEILKKSRSAEGAHMVWRARIFPCWEIPRARASRARKALQTMCAPSALLNNFIIGISIARTNDEKSASIEAGIEDYAYSFRRLNEENVGDYYTINISCPNSFGGETFATPELLTRLLARLKSIPCTKPVYVKMPINITWEQFQELLKVIDQAGLQGVVIGNLNKDYGALDVRGEAPQVYKGGLSGKPCSHPSTDLIYKTRELYGKRFTIIGVGGVMSPETAMEKFDAGADLVQLITGLIYEGPGLVRKLNREYATRLKAQP